MTFVNYKILDRSIDFYDGRGYKRVESPWLISEGISDMTRPSFAAQYVVHKEGFVLKNTSLTLSDLIIMKDATKRAFEDGTRNSRIPSEDGKKSKGNSDVIFLRE